MGPPTCSQTPATGLQWGFAADAGGRAPAECRARRPLWADGAGSHLHNLPRGMVGGALLPHGTGPGRQVPSAGAGLLRWASGCRAHSRELHGQSATGTGGGARSKCRALRQGCPPGLWGAAGGLLALALAERRVSAALPAGLTLLPPGAWSAAGGSTGE